VHDDGTKAKKKPKKSPAKNAAQGIARRGDRGAYMTAPVAAMVQQRIKARFTSGAVRLLVETGQKAAPSTYYRLAKEGRSNETDRALREAQRALADGLVHELTLLRRRRGLTKEDAVKVNQIRVALAGICPLWPFCGPTTRPGAPS
jgi:hypothetical protein